MAFPLAYFSPVADPTEQESGFGVPRTLEAEQYEHVAGLVERQGYGDDFAFDSCDLEWEDEVSVKQGSTRKRRRPYRKAKFRGVRERSNGRWVAEFRDPMTKQRMWLGTYDTAEAAAAAVDEAAIQMHGPRAKLNFPRPATEMAANSPFVPPPSTPTSRAAAESSSAHHKESQPPAVKGESKDSNSGSSSAISCNNAGPRLSAITRGSGPIVIATGQSGSLRGLSLGQTLRGSSRLLSLPSGYLSGASTSSAVRGACEARAPTSTGLAGPRGTLLGAASGEATQEACQRLTRDSSHSELPESCGGVLEHAATRLSGAKTPTTGSTPNQPPANSQVVPRSVLGMALQWSSIPMTLWRGEGQAPHQPGCTSPSTETPSTIPISPSMSGGGADSSVTASSNSAVSPAGQGSLLDSLAGAFARSLSSVKCRCRMLQLPPIVMPPTIGFPLDLPDAEQQDTAGIAPTEGPLTALDTWKAEPGSPHLVGAGTPADRFSASALGASCTECPRGSACSSCGLAPVATRVPLLRLPEGTMQPALREGQSTLAWPSLASPAVEEAAPAAGDAPAWEAPAIAREAAATGAAGGNSTLLLASRERHEGSLNLPLMGGTIVVENMALKSSEEVLVSQPEYLAGDLPPPGTGSELTALPEAAASSGPSSLGIQPGASQGAARAQHPFSVSSFFEFWISSLDPEGWMDDRRAPSNLELNSLALGLDGPQALSAPGPDFPGEELAPEELVLDDFRQLGDDKLSSFNPFGSSNPLGDTDLDPMERARGCMLGGAQIAGSLPQVEVQQPCLRTGAGGEAVPYTQAVAQSRHAVLSCTDAVKADPSWHLLLRSLPGVVEAKGGPMELQHGVLGSLDNRISLLDDAATACLSINDVEDLLMD